jgi:hypothetical protein
MTKTALEISLSPPRFKLLNAADKDKLGRLIGGDPRPRQALIDAGYVEVYGYNYGPLLRITEAGRAAVAAVLVKRAAR